MRRAALFAFSYAFGVVKTTDETVRFFADAASAQGLGMGDGER